MGTGAVTVPIYTTNTTGQAKYIIDEAEIRIVFSGDEDQYQKALEIFNDSESTVEKIIVLEKSVFVQSDVAMYFDDFLKLSNDETEQLAEQRLEEIDGTDLATIIYTSGTTGEPKGVMLAHDSFDEALKIHDIRLNIDRSDHSLCFLPLSHVFERYWSLYALYKGIKNSYLGEPKEILSALSEDFSMNMGELTPTLKIRRKIILNHFRSLIDEMYTF